MRRWLRNDIRGRRREVPAAIAGRARAVSKTWRPPSTAAALPIKRVVGEPVEVEADCFADGHDCVGCVLLYRRDDEAHWHETPMAACGNDRWRGTFTVVQVGRYRYTVTAWVDRLPVVAARLRAPHRGRGSADRCASRARSSIAAAGRRAAGADRDALAQWAARLRGDAAMPGLRVVALDEELAAIASRYPDRRFATTTEIEFPVIVDRERARFSAWYELFPALVRSGLEHPRHVSRLRVEAAVRRARWASTCSTCRPSIRSAASGGRDATTRSRSARATSAARGRSAPPRGDTRRSTRSSATSRISAAFAARARKLGLEIALDIAFQCAPDHPWVAAHPPWFRRRPDGTVQYAENPPKKYQDIYPLNFESDDWIGAVVGARKRVRLLAARGGADLPGGQSAHQALRLLGVGDRTDQGASIRT